jgi:hypothetical protein
MGSVVINKHYAKRDMFMIKVNNWSRYQSYKDRRPPWIRFHRTILDDYQFQMMSAEARALLPMLWLLACENEDPTSGLIPYELEEISFRLRIKLCNLKSAISEIQVTGFIECISSVTKPLQDSNSPVTPETETETETDKPFQALKFLIDLGVKESLAKDFLKVRKTKRATNTERAFKTIQGEIEKKGLPANDIIGMCVDESWAGFKASWEIPSKYLKDGDDSVNKKLCASACYNYKTCSDLGKLKKGKPCGGYSDANG